MNDLTILLSTEIKRAMRPYCLLLYTLVFEGNMENVLEIGVRWGQSTQVILATMKEKGGGLLTSIDIKKRGKNFSEDLFPYWRFVVGDSRFNKTYQQVADKKYDLLLIDGSHIYGDVKSDWQMYSPLVKKGGYVLFHDVVNNNCGVPQFWEEINIGHKHTITLPFNKAGMGIVEM